MSWIEKIDNRFLKKTTFSALGRGFLLDKDGLKIPQDEYKERYKEEKASRRRYLGYDRSRSSGKRWRKALDPIVQQVVSVRPDHHVGLARAADDGLDIEPLLTEWLKKASDCFTRETGYELVYQCVHATEGVLHMHIIYATVTKEGENLHLTGRVGRHGHRYAGPQLLASHRMLQNNIPMTEEHTKFVEKCTDDRKRKGSHAPDIVVQEFLDGLIEEWLVRAGQRYNHHFEEGYRRWFDHHQETVDLKGRVAALEQETKKRRADLAESERQRVMLQKRLDEHQRERERLLRQRAADEKSRIELERRLAEFQSNATLRSATAGEAAAEPDRDPSTSYKTPPLLRRGRDTEDLTRERPLRPRDPEPPSR